MRIKKETKYLKNENKKETKYKKETEWKWKKTEIMSLMNLEWIIDLNKINEI